jgi:hypothetical protein
MRRLRRVGYRTVKAPRTSPVGTYVFDPDTFGSASLGGSAGGAFSASWLLARLHFDAAWVRFGTIGLRPVWIPRPDVLELRFIRVGPLWAGIFKQIYAPSGGPPASDGHEPVIDRPSARLIFLTSSLQSACTL